MLNSLLCYLASGWGGHRLCSLVQWTGNASFGPGDHHAQRRKWQGNSDLDFGISLVMYEYAGLNKLGSRMIKVSSYVKVFLQVSWWTWLRSGEKMF